MTESTVKVSVVIAAYKAAATLTRAIDSLAAQTLTDWEAIIVEDASPDDTLEMARSLAARDQRVRVIPLERNSRQSVARNRGIEDARGEWVAVLDADDAFTPDRLATLVAYAERHALDIVADNQLFYDATAQQISRASARPDAPDREWTLATHLVEERVGRSFKWGLLKPLIRRAFLTQTGVRYRPEYHMGEDSLFYMELLAHSAKGRVIAQPMYIYTTARGEISGQASAASTSRYRFDEHFPIYTFFGDLYGARLNAAESAALRTAMRATIASDQSVQFKSDVKGGRLTAALARFARHPGLSYFLYKGADRYFRHRLPHKIKARLASRRGNSAA